MIPVGGVFLAIVILVLALSPPGAFRPALPAAMMPAHGPLLARDDHPQWRQFLMLAALRRAGEVKRLRQLANSPLHSVAATPAKAQPATEVAGVPANRADTDRDDVTGTIAPSPDASIPLGIGESSSTELPVIPHEERPPMIMTPARNTPSNDSLNGTPKPAKPAHETRKRTLRHGRRATRTAQSAAPVQFNLLEALFGAKPDRPAAKPPR